MIDLDSNIPPKTNAGGMSTRTIPDGTDGIPPKIFGPLQKRQSARGMGTRFCLHCGKFYYAENYDDVCPNCVLIVGTEFHRKTVNCPTCNREIVTQSRRRGEG